MPKTTMISEIMSRNVIYLNEEDNLTRIVEGESILLLVEIQTMIS